MDGVPEMSTSNPAAIIGKRASVASLLTLLAGISFFVGFLPVPLFALAGLLTAVSALAQNRRLPLPWFLIAVNIVFIAAFILIWMMLTPNGYGPAPVTHSYPL